MVFDAESSTKCQANRLVIQIQPAEGIQLHFETKVPDAGMKLRLTDLEFSFNRDFPGVMPEAYERLLLDAFQGDASLFSRADEVELAWSIIDPIAAAWKATASTEPGNLRAGRVGAGRTPTSGCTARAGSGSIRARCFPSAPFARFVCVNHIAERMS